METIDNTRDKFHHIVNNTSSKPVLHTDIWQNRRVAQFCFCFSSATMHLCGGRLQSNWSWWAAVSGLQSLPPLTPTSILQTLKGSNFKYYDASLFSLIAQHDFSSVFLNWYIFLSWIWKRKYCHLFISLKWITKYSKC